MKIMCSLESWRRMEWGAVSQGFTTSPLAGPAGQSSVMAVPLFQKLTGVGTSKHYHLLWGNDLASLSLGFLSFNWDLKTCQWGGFSCKHQNNH